MKSSQGVKIIFTKGYLSLMVALKGPVVINFVINIFSFG